MDFKTWLTEHDLSVEWFEHEAVFTCEDSEKLPNMGGTDTKNLFLRDKKKSTYVLVSIPHEKRADLKTLGEVLGLKGVGFASPEDLEEKLGVKPGSVTLMGLINDPQHDVAVVIDESLWNAEAIRCHPLRNTASIVISHADLEKFLETTGHNAQILDVPSI